MMALEGQDVPDKFFKGLQMLVDGADENKLVTQQSEIKAMRARHEANQGVVKAWIDIDQLWV